MKDYGFTATLAVTVKYVRHEIRSLSEDDRGAFLDALSVCYGTQDDEGKRTYGDKYRSSHYMIRKHLEGAASKDCDHWHDDAGIVNHHVAFTLEMEQALQAVNPAVTIPYWDYSFDSYYYNASAKSCGDACLGSDWTASDVWTDDWFGPIANASSGYAVAGSGRFAWLPVMSRASGARAFSTITNSYGALRSPWARGSGGCSSPSGADSLASSPSHGALARSEAAAALDRRLARLRTETLQLLQEADDGSSGESSPRAPPRRAAPVLTPTLEGDWSVEGAPHHPAAGADVSPTVQPAGRADLFA